MLLGSPPDMVRGYPSRKTGSAAVCGGHRKVFYYMPSQDATQIFDFLKIGALQIKKTVVLYFG